MNIKTSLRVIGVVFSLALLLTLASFEAGAMIPPATPSPWDDPVVRGKIHPALLKQLLQDQARPLPVVVEMNAQADLAQAEHLAASGARPSALAVALLRSTAEASQRDMLAFLAAQASAGRADHIRPLWIVNAVGVHATPPLVWELARRSDVKLVRADRWRQWLDSQVLLSTLRLSPSDLRDPKSEIQNPQSKIHNPQSAIEWNILKIRADEVWAALGITGTGVVVANMDTGVDWLHPALSGNYRGCDRGLCQHTASWFDATPNGATYPVDGNGHGTHTMGTLAGQGGIGVAPGARWIAVRVLNPEGYGYDTWIHTGFQWLLAPGGDPAMAPDLVSNSWGKDVGSDTAFQADLRALRAAGILPVFSNGNKGPSDSTVGSPASLPESYAVGATDDTDMVTYFSSRGPSPWGEIRPHVVAPGVEVRSAWPGGAYQSLDGTSMAAPHVAGVAALMLSAQPSLTISHTMYVLTTTAVPLSTTIPNNESGWGRVDAYAAVMAVANAGTLSGTIRDAATAMPIAEASVTVSGTHLATTQTDADGHYLIGMASGVYNVTASAFGYEPGLAFNVIISHGLTAVRNFDLVPLPTGRVQGALTDATSGLPITATVRAMGTPITQTAWGVYSLTLPAGTYTLRATQLGYRVLTTTVTITAGETITRDLALMRGPKILLVDSGVWYSQSEIGYFRQSLDELAYAYDVWPIRHPPGDAPRGSDLLPYDVVIWSSPLDSPGYVGANQAMTTFLTSTHNLLLTGQDVAYWDGGGSMFIYGPYLEQYLKTRYVADDSGSRLLTGLEGDIMAGLTMTIAGPGGADNQVWPDVIAVSDPRYASQVLAYQGDGSGGQKVGMCLPYRGTVLSFGYEAITDAATRRSVMQRAMDYFASPPQVAGLELSPSYAAEVARPGDTVTYTLSLRNVSQVATDTITLTNSGAWPHGHSPATAVVSSCHSITVTLAVTVPHGLGLNVSDAVTLTARSSLSPSLSVTSVLVTKTPAPVLLVDDSRWYGPINTYSQALTQVGVAYDTWRVNPPQGFPQVPPASRLAWYPVVVWFTGYNWYDPVKAAGETSLDSYLGGGGRLFLSSAFYLDMLGPGSFARTRLGVMTYTYDLTTSLAYGAASSPIGHALGTFSLNNPYPLAGFFTLAGAVAPEYGTLTALRSDSDRALAIHRAETNSRNVFMATPFEAFDGPDAARVMQRIVGWLSWLGDSTLAADRSVAMPGERVAFTLTARHNGLAPINTTMTATLPTSVTLIPASLTPGARFDPTANVVTWTGTLVPGAAITVSYQITLDAALSSGAWLTTTALFRDDTHGLPFDQTQVVRVAAPDLALSTFTASTPSRDNSLITYTLVISNSGLSSAAPARATLLLPLDTRPMTGSPGLSGPGVVTTTGSVIHWQGILGAGEAATLTYRLMVPQPYTGMWLLNEALLWDGAGGAWERAAWVDMKPYRVYLPVILK